MGYIRFFLTILCEVCNNHNAMSERLETNTHNPETWLGQKGLPMSFVSSHSGRVSIMGGEKWQDTNHIAWKK